MISRIMQHLGSSFRHHGGLMLITILVLTGSFVVSGGLVLTGHNLEKVLTLWGDSLQMSVYLKDEVTPEQTDRLRERLNRDKRVGHTEWVDREMALKSFQEQMASYAPDLLKDTQLARFIPESFQVQISETISSALQFETLRDLAAELKGLEGVDDVSYGQDWVKTYASVMQTLSHAGSWLVAILLAASAFVISNAVSSSIQQRRGEIEVLELVGASKWFIRAPFLAEGFFVGAVSGIFALLCLGAGFSFLLSEFKGQIAFLQLSHHLEFFSVLSVLGFLATASFLGGASSYICLRRLNDGWSASRMKQGA